MACAWPCDRLRFLGIDPFFTGRHPQSSPIPAGCQATHMQKPVNRFWQHVEPCKVLSTLHPMPQISLNTSSSRLFRFHQVSRDEAVGIGGPGAFCNHKCTPQCTIEPADKVGKRQRYIPLYAMVSDVRRHVAPDVVTAGIFRTRLPHCRCFVQEPLARPVLGQLWCMRLR